jgi:pilus assembly protein Flp/PilA
VPPRHCQRVVTECDDIVEVDRIVRLSAVRQRVPRGNEGQGLAEYALILALIAVAALVAITFLGTSISNLLSSLGNAF